MRLANLKSSASDLKEMIETLKCKVDYDNRALEISQFNATNKWMKKAIYINIMDFPVIYYGNFTVLVSVYRDGTVTVTTGGIEMGQGANTKVAQVCARELGIPLSYIHVISHYSFVASNNGFSGASITTESICYAAIKACGSINNRIHQLKARVGGDESTWEELVKTAAEEEIELTSSYMMTDKEEDLSGYSAYAVSIIEVQLDVLTGRFQLVRVDILEDVGISINPALDVGQVGHIIILK